MNSFIFLSGPVADALGRTLLHAVWQGFALVLPAAVALHLLRNRSSVLRYRIGTLALLSQLLVSAATFVWSYKPLIPTITPRSMAMAVQALPVRWQAITQTLPWQQQVQLFLENHLGQFVFMYLVGVALFGLRLAGGWLYLQRLTQTATDPVSSLCLQLTNRIRSTMAIQPVIQVRESTRIMVPMVVGMLKPVLLLPVSLVTNLTTRKIEAILAHELAHVKRHDYAVNLLQSVIEVLYFFHPALWWLSARVREEREHCCDDLAVLACGGDGRMLARALAHVEELRRTPASSTPALAMALSTNRQQLLHRVQRMLGVPTRPFVSNGSLAGLTLATILLMSVSVYAVQKHSQPKPVKSHSPTTRRHKTGDDTVFSLTDDRKINSVVWKGKKLPASHITRLQQAFDQVMAGQLSLDDVKQPDRDILLELIETTAASAGKTDDMETFADGLTQVDYSDIVASALNNIPLSSDGTVAGLANVNYDSIIKEAMSTVDTNITVFDGGVVNINDRLTRGLYNQRQLDSLNQLMAQRSKQIRAIQLQMEKLRFPIEEIERNQEVLNWRKDKLMEQRDALIEKHQRLLYNDGKQKISQVEVEKQLEAIEPEIKKLESSLESVNQQVEAANAKQEEVKLPLEKLERESEQLEEQIDKLSGQVDQYSDDSDALTIRNVLVRSAPHRAPRTARNVRGLIPPAAPTPPAVTIRPVPALKSAPAPPATRVRGRAISIPPGTPKPASASTPK
ncbi:M56 family metallopeptidase [Spirosoma lituiforme]